MTQTREHLAVNTPLVGNPDTYKEGLPLTYLVANGVENLLESRYLQGTVPAWNLVQTVVIATFAFWIWSTNVALATLASFCIWGLLLFAHALLYRYASVHLPLGDTVLFAAFATLSGALWRLRQDLLRMAEFQAEGKAKLELARLHSRYLDRFSFALSETVFSP